MSPATPPEVRKARAFLRSKGINTKEIPPRKFANAAKELNRGFRELLKFIMHLMSGGQGQSRKRQQTIYKRGTK